MYMNQIELFFFFLICFSLILNGVGSESYTSQNPKERIFEKERLETLKDTIEVSGYVTYINPEIDGDYHLRLKTEDTSLLVKRNYTQQDSCLVLEIVCGKGSIFTACNGYKNLIPVPKIGT